VTVVNRLKVCYNRSTTPGVITWSTWGGRQEGMAEVASCCGLASALGLVVLQRLFCRRRVRGRGRAPHLASTNSRRGQPGRSVALAWSTSRPGDRRLATGHYLWPVWPWAGSVEATVAAVIEPAVGKDPGALERGGRPQCGCDGGLYPGDLYTHRPGRTGAQDDRHPVLRAGGGWPSAAYGLVYPHFFGPSLPSSMALLASSCACCASSRSAVTER